MIPRIIMKPSQIIGQTRYSIARYLRKAAARITPTKDVSGITYPNLGIDRLPKNAPRALIIYAVSGIDRYVRGGWPTDPIFNKHTIYWESVEMVRLLNEAGYIVDFCDVWKPFRVDWDRYALVIDNLNNLKDIPGTAKLKKIYWATNNHWLTWNAGELQRIQWFKDRAGIVVPMNRQMPNIASDEHANYLTYFGTKLQTDSFSPKSEKILINISSCFVPPYQKKNLTEARNKFLLITGGGALHKGVDLVIEAFRNIPDAELFIISNLPAEPQFYQWAAPILAQHPNIHEMGWYDLASKEFDALADQCIGVLYLPSSCGGPGSVARVLHNGLIPIVTPTGFVRAEHLGYQVHGTTDHAIIDGAVECVREIMSLPDQMLQEKSDAVREFAKENHTREAFSRSFSTFIERL